MQKKINDESDDNTNVKYVERKRVHKNRSEDTIYTQSAEIKLSEGRNFLWI